MKKKSVYILGDVRGVYRIQNLIKFFVDRPNEYGIVFDNRISRRRPWKYFKSIVVDPFRILCSDYIYVCIMNVDIDILYSLVWAKILRKKIIVDGYISIYEKVVIDEKWFKVGGLLAKLARFLDRFYYKISTKMIFLAEVEGEHFCELSNVKRKIEKEIYIPLCIEESFKVERKNDEDFNVCWWGSFINLHGLEHILEMIQECDNRGLNIKWYFFGNNAEKCKKYEEMAKEKRIFDKCIFINNYTMKNGKLKEFLQERCDVALGNFGDSSKARFVMTNKVLDACAMKTLVLTCNARAYKDYFDGKSDIYMCENNPSIMADTMEKIYKTCDVERNRRIENSYRIYKENFTVDKYVNNLEKLFLSLK